MKTCIVSFLLLSSLLLNEGQINHKLMLQTHRGNHSKSDSLYVTRDLPVLEADACIGSLLAAVAKSNSKHYHPGRSFYGLVFNKRIKYNYLEVFYDEWHDAKDTDYVAVIKLKNAVFLCSGDIQGNLLFHKTSSSKMRIKLSIAKKSTDIPMLIDPSLQGTFSICKGLPIYVEIYTMERIEGYKMDIRHQTN